MCAEVFSIIAHLIIDCIEERLKRSARRRADHNPGEDSAPLTPVTGIPEEIQPVVGQAVNTAVYHTCA